MGVRKKKGEAGEARRYVNRTKACRLLQLGLPQFRRLCIFKGVYPREPKSRTKAQKGDTSHKTLFLKKDVTYLSHEPIIWKFREEKIYRRKLRALEEARERRDAHIFRKRKRPTYKLDHIVLERYPTFTKALQDLDDALSTCFLFGSMPNLRGVEIKLVQLCRRLTTEFLSYIIESRALRKAFISFKGYFYRAHIQGHKITWVVPHPFPIQQPEDTDLRIMKHFVEFFSTQLGFVNFKLFNSLNLHYPPKLPFKVNKVEGSTRKEEEIMILQSLGAPLLRNEVEDDSNTGGKIDFKFLFRRNDHRVQQAEQEAQKGMAQMNLFRDTKFFLGRETNRESLSFVIRAAGGMVSWDESLGPGCTYQEDNEGIKYQIVDRPTVEKKYLSRYYVQPQWVYDSFNAGLLLPVQTYFVGVTPPAHLSPFEETFHRIYNPPEMRRVQALQDRITLLGDKTPAEVAAENTPLAEGELEWTSDEEEEKEGQVPEGDVVAVLEKKEERRKRGRGQDRKSGKEQREEKEKEGKEREEEDPMVRMKVIRPRPVRRRKEIEEARQSHDDMRLASSLIHRKQKRMFKKVLKRENKQKEWAKTLRRKRIAYEREVDRRRKLGIAPPGSHNSAPPAVHPGDRKESGEGEAEKKRERRTRGRKGEGRPTRGET